MNHLEPWTSFSLKKSCWTLLMRKSYLINVMNVTNHFQLKVILKKHKDRVHVLGFFSKKHFFLPDNSFNCTHCGKIFTHKVKSVLHFIRYLFLRNKCFISTRSISLISNMGLPIHYSYALFQIWVYRFSIPLSISVNYCVVFY